MNMSTATNDPEFEEVTSEIPAVIDPPAIDPTVWARALAIRALSLNTTTWLYVPILLCGLVGNTVAFILLVRKSWKSSTYTYLASLSIVDSVFLLTSTGSWIFYVLSDGKLDLRRVLDCNVFLILIKLSQHSSAWLVVAVTVERALVVYLPTKAKRVTNVKWARVAVGCILASSCVVNWNVFGSYRTVRGPLGVSVDVCSGRTPWIDHYNKVIESWVHSVVYSYLPIICLSILNGAIVTKFLLATRSGKVGPEGGVADASKRTMAKNSRRMTIMGLTLSIAYLILTIPFAIHNLFFRAGLGRIATDPIAFFVDFFVSQMLSAFYHLNHAINLALYTLTNTRFRQDLLELLKCRFDKATRQESSMSKPPTTQSTQNTE